MFLVESQAQGVEQAEGTSLEPDAAVKPELGQTLTVNGPIRVQVRHCPQ